MERTVWPTYAAATERPTPSRINGNLRKHTRPVSHVCFTWLLPLVRDDESRPIAVTQHKGRPDNVDKAGRLEPCAVFAFRVGLPGIEGIEGNQIEAHGLERGGMRIIQNLANDEEPAPRSESRPNVLEDLLRLVG